MTFSRLRTMRYLLAATAPDVAKAAAREHGHRKRKMQKRAMSEGLEHLGLGLIAVGPAHNLINRIRGKKTSEGAETMHHVSDLAGLGILAPKIQKILTKRAGAGSAPSYDLDKVPADAKTHTRVTRDASEDFLREWRRVNKRPQHVGPIKMAAFMAGIMDKLATKIPAAFFEGKVGPEQARADINYLRQAAAAGHPRANEAWERVHKAAKRGDAKNVIEVVQGEADLLRRQPRRIHPRLTSEMAAKLPVKHSAPKAPAPKPRAPRLQHGQPKAPRAGGGGHRAGGGKPKLGKMPSGLGTAGKVGLGVAGALLAAGLAHKAREHLQTRAHGAGSGR